MMEREKIMLFCKLNELFSTLPSLSREMYYLLMGLNCFGSFFATGVHELIWTLYFQTSDVFSCMERLQRGVAAARLFEVSPGLEPNAHDGFLEF